MLYLNEDDFSLAVSRFNIHSVEFVVWLFLVAFAFQNLDDVNGLVEKNGNQSLEHAKVGLVTQHTLGSPVKTDVFVVVFHIVAFLCKLTKKKRE